MASPTDFPGRKAPHPSHTGSTAIPLWRPHRAPSPPLTTVSERTKHKIMEKPLILISNDDGITAKGITELVRMVSPLGTVIVCAPDGPRSGRSRAFSLTPLTLTPFSAPQHGGGDVTWYSCNGTPVDCVKMAFALLCPRKPSLVIGGINHGDNASTNAHYSGTMGIAFEGTIKGVPSVAFSLCDYDADADFRPMEDIVRRVCRHVLTDGLPKGVCLNVNVPKAGTASDLRGVRICRMAQGGWHNEVEKIEGDIDESGRQRYILKGFYRNYEPEAEDTDAWALANGYVAVTPCTNDMTAYAMEERLQDIITGQGQDCRLS